jgi:hypothetical protein
MHHVVRFELFCGLPALVPLMFGLLRLVQERRWLRLALLTAAPLLLNLVLLGKMWEVRQFLVLTPFLGGLIALGGEALLADWRNGRRIALVAFVLLEVAVLAPPPLGISISDGPRTILGRIAGIRLWRNWQQVAQSDNARIGAVVDAAPAGRPLAVLTDGWNDDRYLHLRLLERGFVRAPLPPACAAVGEGWRRGDRTVITLSLLPTFVPYWPILLPRRLEQGALPCLAQTRPARTVLLAQQYRVASLLDRDLRPVRVDPALRAGGVSEIVAVPMTPDDIGWLDRAYRRDAALYGPPREPIAGPAAFASQTPFSR